MICIPCLNSHAVIGSQETVIILWDIRILHATATLAKVSRLAVEHMHTADLN